MEYVEFGCNKTKVSKVVLGCMRIQQLGTQGLCSLLDTALDCGINFIDTADCYSNGQSEELLGDAFTHNPNFRETFFLQSKCGIRIDSDFVSYDFTKDYIISCVENS